MNVFISHNSADKNAARMLALALRRLAATVWFDEWHIAPGESIVSGIESGLGRCEIFVLLWSNNARSSSWVSMELRAYIRRRVDDETLRIVPLMLDETPLPLLVAEYRGFKCTADATAMEAIAQQLVLSPAERFPLETVRCDIELDIRRVDGSVVQYTKRQVHRCVVAGVDHFVEKFTGDGTIRDFEAFPGKVERTWTTEGLLHILHRFPASLARGEQLERVFRCRWYGTFSDPEGYWVARQHSPMDDLSVTVVFPKTRPVKTFRSFVRRGEVTSPLPSPPEHLSVRGRPAVRITVTRPDVLVDYVLEWEW